MNYFHFIHLKKIREKLITFSYVFQPENPHYPAYTTRDIQMNRYKTSLQPICFKFKYTALR